MDRKVVQEGCIYEFNMMQTKFVRARRERRVCALRDKDVCVREIKSGHVAVYLGVVILAWHLGPVWHCLFPSLSCVLCMCHLVSYTSIFTLQPCKVPVFCLHLQITCST